jgi:hypothetical protein
MDGVEVFVEMAMTYGELQKGKPRQRAGTRSRRAHRAGSQNWVTNLMGRAQEKVYPGQEIPQCASAS